MCFVKEWREWNKWLKKPTKSIWTKNKSKFCKLLNLTSVSCICREKLLVKVVNVDDLGSIHTCHIPLQIYNEPLRFRRDIKSLHSAFLRRIVSSVNGPFKGPILWNIFSSKDWPKSWQNIDARYTANHLRSAIVKKHSHKACSTVMKWIG